MKTEETVGNTGKAGEVTKTVTEIKVPEVDSPVAVPLLVNTIVQQDVVEFLKEQEDSSAQLIIADPPYNISFDGGKGWDSYPDEDTYLKWCKEWVDEAARVLKPGGVFLVWGTLKTDTFLKLKLDVLNKAPGLVSQGELIWENNWGGRSPKNFARKHEYSWVYSKGEDFTFNADSVRKERKMKHNPRTGKPYDKGTIPTRIFQENNHTGSKDRVAWHPTPKNIKVISTLIEAYSDSGDRVLDIFSGSGTTTLCAMRTGRESLGCELDEEYYTKILERLSKESSK